MKGKLIENNILYNGSQLSPLFSYLNYGLLGDSIISFLGPCHVDNKFMVDGEDVREKSIIKGDLMVHFIVEIFTQKHLAFAVSCQRLLGEMSLDVLKSLSLDEKISQMRRQGDDLYYKNQKFNISIATSSPVSCLIHFAVNVTQKGTPVETISLDDFKIKPQEFSKKVMESFCSEYDSIMEACCKVKPVS